MKHFKLLTAALMTSLCISCGSNKTLNNPASQPEGGERGNGADYHYSGENNPWFLGKNNTIKYCALASPTFGVDLQEIEKSISFAFKTWADYFVEKDAHLIGHENIMFTVQTQKLNSCDGSQDLTFYFGVTDKDTAVYQKKSPNSVGYSVRTSQDLKKNWSKGFIWIAPPGSIKVENQPNAFFPNWKIGNSLKGILIHELGHAYGIDHTPGTIMSENFVDLLLEESDKNPVPALTSIDHRKELLLDYENIKKDGRLGYYNESITHDGKVTKEEIFENIQSNFKMLMGRAAVGEITARVYGQQMNGLVLEVIDAKGAAVFPIELAVNNDPELSTTYINTGKPITITTQLSEDMTSIHTISSSSRAEIIYARLKMGSKSLDITIERNLNVCIDGALISKENQWTMCGAGSSLTIKYFSKSKAEPLFLGKVVEGAWVD